MGVSLNGGTPHFTPQVMIIFSRKTHGLLGKPTILGKPPNGDKILPGSLGVSRLTNLQQLPVETVMETASGQATYFPNDILDLAEKT